MHSLNLLLVLPTLTALAAASSVSDDSNTTLSTRGDPAGTWNLWKGRCNWNFHKDNVGNMRALSDYMGKTGYFQFAKEYKANEIFWCINGLCAWTDRDGVDGNTIQAAARKMDESNCCGSCGSVALHGNDMSKGMLTFNYPSKCHDRKTGNEADCNQFAIMDKCDF